MQLASVPCDIFLPVLFVRVAEFCGTKMCNMQSVRDNLFLFSFVCIGDSLHRYMYVINCGPRFHRGGANPRRGVRLFFKIFAENCIK